MKAAIAAALLLSFPPLPAGGERVGVEGEEVPPDVAVADRPGPAGAADAIVEAAIRALERYPR